MAKTKLIITTEAENEDYKVNIPSVDNESIEPRIRIYDPDGTYWSSKIGFNRKITDLK